MLGNQIWFCDKGYVPSWGVVCVGGGWGDDEKTYMLPRKVSLVTPNNRRRFTEIRKYGNTYNNC
jgi:hypothetical protein